MKRHISIFTFLLGALSAAGLAPAAFAGTQNVSGGHYYFDGSWTGADVKYMSTTNRHNGSLTTTVQNVEDGTGVEFTAHPDPGMSAASWKALFGQSAQNDIMRIKDWPTGLATTNYTLVADSSKGSVAYLAVNFTYIPLTVRTNNVTITNGTINTTGIKLPSSSKIGYTGKWKNEKGDTFEFGAKVSGKDFWYDEDWAFHADLKTDWTANTYTIVFVGNGETGGSMKEMSCTYDVSTNLTKNAFERTHYAFAGWNTKDDGTGDSYPNGASVKNLTAENGGTVTLYAQWTLNRYTVKTQVADGSKDKGETTPASVTQDADTTLTITAKPKDGYAFAQWNDGSAVASRTIQVVSNATYEATFTNRVFTMTFDPNGGTCEMTSKKIVFQDPIGELPTPEKGLNTFDYWWTKDGIKVTEIKQDGAPWTYTWTRDVTLIAHWVESPGYKIVATCDPKKGEVKVEGKGLRPDGTFVENTEVVFTATENDGYSFSHWEKGQSVYTDNPFTNLATESVTYIGVFTGKVYKVTFLSLEGSPLQQEKFVTFGSAYGTLPTVNNVKDRVLDGWYTGLSGSGTKIEPTTEVDQPNNDRILFANWKDAPFYYIAFDGNGATNTTMEVQKAYCGEDVVLASNQYARMGYTFNGWTNSVGKVYRDGATVRDLANTNETATLYAAWSPISYTLAFDPQGGDFGQALVPMDCIYGREYVLQYKEGTKELCDFAGWSNVWNGAVYSEENGFNVKDAYDVPNGTNTLKAIWISRLTDYSRAMHCTNLVWKPAGGGWICVTNSSAGYDPSGTCVRGNRGGTYANLTESTTTNAGTLVFWWKSSVDGGILKVGRGADSVTLTAQAEDRWQQDEVPVPSGLSPIELNVLMRNYTVDIDQMTWTPKPLHPVPDPEKDFVTISSAAILDGKFSLSFEFNEEFDYLLKTNANLLSDSWGVMEIEGTKTDNILTFEPQIIEGQPQLFYKVETIQKN